MTHPRARRSTAKTQDKSRSKVKMNSMLKSLLISPLKKRWRKGKKFDVERMRARAKRTQELLDAGIYEQVMERDWGYLNDY